MLDTQKVQSKKCKAFRIPEKAKSKRCKELRIPELFRPKKAQNPEGEI